MGEFLRVFSRFLAHILYSVPSSVRGAQAATTKGLVLQRVRSQAQRRSRRGLKRANKEEETVAR